ncbi:MAG: HAMP domain-containing histidine kinase [Saprospiraceae bacterium]|nr:HAMP domain-containing histidine kinase [Saprospiraceae bacterium]
MTKKLLNKTSRAYSIFALLVLLVSAPFFYIATEELYIDDADEALILRKNEFLKYFASSLKESDIPVWNSFNRDVKIKDPTPVLKDTLFYSVYFDSLSKEDEPYRELNARILIEGKPYTLSARINLVETEDLIKSVAILFFIIILLLLLGLLIINRKWSQNLWKPFYETLYQIEKFEIDKSIKPDFPKTDVEEFTRLNHSLERLIEKNTLIYQSQREFIENAAHELQTPLAVFQAKIDMLIQSGEFTAQQYQILNSLNDAIARLNRLNKNLLLLSKIENDSYQEKQNVSLTKIIKNLLDFFTEQASANNIKIKTELREHSTVFANPVLIEILISNLFLNAIRHNVKNGHIEVTLTEDTLSFSNTGENKALDVDKIFIRFSKSNPSEHGNGLGLAIIKKIVELNHWEITYSFDNFLHTFQIKLK